MTSQAEQPATPILLRKTYGWPGHTPDEAQIAACLPLAEAFTTECPDDHHFVAYAERAVNDVAVRLTTAALEPEHVQALDVPNVTMQLLVFDVDDPIAHDQKTAARSDWCEDERAKRERLLLIAPGFASYNSKGGYRLIWRLEGVELTSPGDAEAWKDFYTGALAWLKEHSGIEGDPQCKDWTRLYRLPNVVRDGKPARSTIEGALGEPWPLDRTIEPAKPARSAKVRSNRTEPHGGAPAVVEPLIAALADAVEPTWSDHNHNGWRFPFLGWLAGKGWSPAERAALLHELAERDETSAALRRKYANANDRAKSLDGPGDIVRETLGEAFGVVDRIVGRHPSAMANAYAVHREQRAEIGCVPGPQPFDAFKGSEQGDANEFAHFHADEVAWILEWARYIGWDGKRWSLSGGEMKARRAWQDLLAAKLETAAKIEDLEARKKLVDYVRSCMTRQRENNVLALAQSRLAVELARLDSDPWILNLENGILDLRTMEARAHDPATLCTRLAPVAWDENANCPRWLEFLDWAMCGNQELVGYLQRFFGLALTGDASHEVMHVFHGEGSNGKTTAVVTLEALLGGYAVRAPAKLLMAARHEQHPTEFADFAHRRLVTLAETKEDQELDDQVLKLVASKDPIAARRMREDFWRFEPTHKSLLLTNHRPRVKGQDWGVWRRIVLVPWLATVRETDKDLQLPAKLRAELPGILAWAAAGCLDVQREGLRPPRAVQEATDGYRSQENAVARWVVAECNRGPDFETKARDLCSAYNSWALVSRESRLSERAFADRLKAKPLGFEKKDRRDGAYWQGLKLKAR